MKIPKFRAWRKNVSQMVNVSSLFWGNEEGVDILFANWWYVTGDSFVTSGDDVSDEFILMQSTGLLDKNGEEVYIGDIVKCTRGCTHEVIFIEGYGGTFIGGMPAFYLSGIAEGYAWTEDEEIVGNIYENPELLEEITR